MPVVLGEVDVIKSLSAAGVTNAGEGASGFNVRGGGADQNLILLDEATIFNSSHVLVFLRFLPRCYKGFKTVQGIPLILEVVSSVLDIYQRRKQQRIPHEWRYRVNFQQTITGRSTSKDKGSFLMEAEALMVIYFKTF
jgi:hypothetical protein